MYQDTVTVFNRYKSRLGDIIYPTTLYGVNVNIDKAGVVATYGDVSQDRVILNIKRYGDFIGDKKFLPPKEWANQTNDKLHSTITLAEGDFFIVGIYDDSKPINDDDYADGFFDYLNKSRDYAYMITSVSMFSVIPHFEVTGK